MAASARFGSLLSMRILIALGANALSPQEGADGAVSQRRDIEAAARVLASVASEHEVVIALGNGPEAGLLELALRNELPDRDLITVLSRVVVSDEDSALGTPPEAPLAEPQAIVELRSLRTLIDAGVLVLCSEEGATPMTVDGDGLMRGVDVAVDENLTAALLARRLDADLLVILTSGEGSTDSQVEAASRFAEATDCRAAIGEIRKAVEIVRGGGGIQISPRHA